MSTLSEDVLAALVFLIVLYAAAAAAYAAAAAAAAALKAFEEAAVRCRSNLNGGACVCDPKCFDVCYVEAEANEIDECSLDHDRRAREES